jgi:DNA transformation protein
MFGGSGLYRDGVMFALAINGEIFLKSDDLSAPAFEAAGCRAFMYAKDGKSVTMCYWSIPDTALDDREILKQWADLAYQAALRTAKPCRKR